MFTQYKRLYSLEECKMNRRSVVFLLSSLPFAFLSGCKQNDDKRIPKDEVNNIQDTLLQYYNIGKIDSILVLYDENCTYASDSVFGGIDTIERSLRILYKYHSKKKLLPLMVDIKGRRTIIQDDVAWIVSQLHNAKRRKHGFLTLTLKHDGSGWKIVHHHFISQ